MRSHDEPQNELFCTISIESLIPPGHPLRTIRQRADRALQRLEPVFEKLYASTGRPSVPPEQVLRALLLQVLYGFRSERRRMEEMRYNFALRWFVGLTMSQEPWDVTVFTKNRARFLESDLAQQWLKAVVMEAHDAKLIDPEHFSVDGTLIQAWASEGSYRPKDDPPSTGTGRGGKLLKRDVFESSTDPDARLYRKSARDAFRLGFWTLGDGTPQRTDRGQHSDQMLGLCRTAGRRRPARKDSTVAQATRWDSAARIGGGGYGLSRTGFCGGREAAGIRSASARMAATQAAGSDWGGVAPHGSVSPKPAKTEVDRAMLRPG